MPWGLGGGVGHCVSHQASNPHCDRHVEAVAMLADLVVQVRLNCDLDQSAVVVFAGGHRSTDPCSELIRNFPFSSMPVITCLNGRSMASFGTK